MGAVAWLTEFIRSVQPVWDAVSFVVGPAFAFFAMSIFPFRFPKRHGPVILALAAVLDGFVLFLADRLINGGITNVDRWAYLRVSLVSFVVIAAGALLLYRGNKLLISLTVLLLYNIFSAIRFVFVGLLEWLLPEYGRYMAICVAILPTSLFLAASAALVVRLQESAVSGLSAGESWVWFGVAFLSTGLMGLKAEFATSWWQMVLNGVDLVLANAVIYILIFLYSKQKFIAGEQQKILSNIDGYKGYLDQMKELDSHISTVHHEVRNHVFYIDELLRQENYTELRAYVDRLRQADLGASRVIDTGNPIVDSIVNAKLTYAETLGIRTECAIQLPETVAIDDLSLCSLLGNLLNNAIEGSAQVDEPWVGLDIHGHKDYLIITVRNRVLADVIRNNPHLRTTKSDAENHGFGLKVLEQIVNLYGGDLRLGMADPNTFSASVMIKNRAVSQPGKH